MKKTVLTTLFVIVLIFGFVGCKKSLKNIQKTPMKKEVEKEKVKQSVEQKKEVVEIEEKAENKEILKQETSENDKVKKNESEKPNDIVEKIIFEDVKEEPEIKVIKDKKTGKIKLEFKGRQYNIDVEQAKKSSGYEIDVKEKITNTIDYFVGYIYISSNENYLLFNGVCGKYKNYSELKDMIYYYDFTNKRIKKIIKFPNDVSLQRCLIINNGNIIMLLDKNLPDEEIPLEVLNIYDKNLNKLFEIDIMDKGYSISPFEDYIIIIDRSNKKNKIFKYDINLNKFALIYEIDEYEVLSLDDFSKNDKYFILRNRINNNLIRLFLFNRDYGLLWEKEFTKKDLNVEKFDYYFKFSNNSQYLIYNNNIIDIKTGNIIKNNLTDEELKKYEVE